MVLFSKILIWFFSIAILLAFIEFITFLIKKKINCPHCNSINIKVLYTDWEEDKQLLKCRRCKFTWSKKVREPEIHG